MLALGDYQKFKRLLRFLIGAIVSLVFSSGFFLFLANINLLDYLPRIFACRLQLLFNVRCPACGLSRSFLLLGQLKVKEALETNLLSLPLFLLMLFYLVLGRAPFWMKKKRNMIFILIVIFIFWSISIVAVT